MKVVLIGDSIRMGYQPFVAKKLPEVEVWGPEVYGSSRRTSFFALSFFHEWVVEQHPDFLHVNFGIHDAARRYPDGEHQIILAQYRLCLQRYVAEAKKLEKTRMIWASTTPLYEADPATPMSHWHIKEEAEIKEYNAVAFEIAEKEKLPVNDLHDVILRNDFSKCLQEDGCHMTDFGNEVLSDAVVETIRALL